MFVLGLILVLVLLSAFFNQHLANRENPNSQVVGTASGTVREVVLQRNAFGHYVASGEINGQPVEFMLDTGATRVSIPSEVAARIGLKKGAPGLARTANGTIEVHSTRLDEVRLGSIRMPDVSGSINPGLGDGQILLGMAFLKHLEMIQRGDTLILRQYF